jgi:hypothetical protein
MGLKLQAKQSKAKQSQQQQQQKQGPKSSIIEAEGEHLLPSTPNKNTNFLYCQESSVPTRSLL